MLLNRYQWAALAAALLTPALLFAASTQNKKNKRIKMYSQNLKAFLLMIQFSEGTYGPNAYRTLYGGGLFDDLAKHPDKPITKWGITSTAAGAYGFLFRIWSELQTALQLPDFSPVSQDKAAIELIRRKGALTDVLAGNLQQAVYKCRKIWASFPGAGYSQHENTLEKLAKFYEKAGGKQLTA